MLLCGVSLARLSIATVRIFTRASSISAPYRRLEGDDKVRGRAFDFELWLSELVVEEAKAK